MTAGPVTIRGTEYPDAQAAAEAFDVSRKAITNAARLGRLDYVGIPAHKTRTRHGVEAAPVRIRGKVYPSAKAAARRFKVSEETVRGAINRGREDFVGLGRSRKHSTAHVGRKAYNARPLKIGRHEWPSIRLCARELGLRESTLRDRLKLGDSEWLLCRIAEFIARKEGHKPGLPVSVEEYGQKIRDAMRAARDRAIALPKPQHQQEGAAA